MAAKIHLPAPFSPIYPVPSPPPQSIPIPNPFLILNLETMRREEREGAATRDCWRWRQLGRRRVLLQGRGRAQQRGSGRPMHREGRRMVLRRHCTGRAQQRRKELPLLNPRLPSST
ncbi:hypothetical protein SETIT_3G238900v2 [Setaria italica]|uniref:Uncharacterized protein n=2 Tax=Setaria TaxID=4554 RepID=A0A368QIB3_SETIT|nr:hypothetical protein SETIT_3G238900v2 [Setaria italica]TKW27231.1 hypothetical protein SEVIR_3G244400v2 [Setaria viridis]